MPSPKVEPTPLPTPEPEAHGFHDFFGLFPSAKTVPPVHQPVAPKNVEDSDMDMLNNMSKGKR